MEVTKDLLNNIIDAEIAEITKSTKTLVERELEDRQMGFRKPKVVNLHTDLTSEASNIYVRTKGEALEESNIDYVLEDCSSMTLGFLCVAIRTLNDDDEVTSIIVQLPLREELRPHTDYILNLISPEKDIDRLGKSFAYSKETDDLPITSLGMYNVFNRLYKEHLMENIMRNAKSIPIAFMGNGMTTNKRLRTFMDEKGMNCRMINSKTSSSVSKEIIENARVIFSAVGVHGALDIDENKHEEIFIISPTIDCKKSDLSIEQHSEKESKLKIHHHNTFGKLGKLTVATLVNRAHLDAARIRTKMKLSSETY